MDIEEKLQKFDSYIKQLRMAKAEYERKFNGRSYQLILANGEVIFLSFTPNILAHLLGVQYSYLKKHELFKGMSSYDALTLLCNNSEVVEKEIENGNIDINLLFSPMFERKILSIIRAPHLKVNVLNTILFACKYNEHISIKNSEKNPLQSEYIVGMNNENNDMSILGLIKDEDSNCFKINSNLLIPNDSNYFSELKNMIGYQTLTYPVSATLYRQSSYSSEPKLVYLKEADKAQKIEELEYYCDKLGTNIDSTADTKRQLKQVIKEKDFRIQTLEMLRAATMAISTGTPIDLEDYKDMGEDRTMLLININNMINRLQLAESTLQPILQATENYENAKINSLKKK